MDQNILGKFRLQPYNFSWSRHVDIVIFLSPNH